MNGLLKTTCDCSGNGRLDTFDDIAIKELIIEDEEDRLLDDLEVFSVFKKTYRGIEL